MSNPLGPLPRYVSLAQASAITELSTRTLRRAIAVGRLRVCRVGRIIRIDVADLQRWIEGDGEAIPVVAGPAASPSATAVSPAAMQGGDSRNRRRRRARD